MQNGEVLGVILLVGFLFFGTLIALYVAKIGFTLLQGYLDRDPDPIDLPDPFPENIPNPEIKSPEQPPF